MSIITKIFGDPSEKAIKEMQPVIDRINGFEEAVSKLSAAELAQKTQKFKKDLAGLSADKLQESLDAVLPEAFACVREAAKRVLGQRHYDVQLIGGIVLHGGQIAEMKTGEGKTLVATLPLYLNALSGKGAHLVTVNDYLSRVGAGWMAPGFHLLGMTTGVIIHDKALGLRPGIRRRIAIRQRLKHFRPVAGKEAYASDITYGTNNEFGFDYLRDNMAASLEQRGPARTLFRDRGRGRLDPDRRSPDAAHHQRAGGRIDRQLLPVRPPGHAAERK